MNVSCCEIVSREGYKDRRARFETHNVIWVPLVEGETTAEMFHLVKPSALLCELDRSTCLGHERIEDGLEAGLVSIVETLEVDKARRHEEPHVELLGHILRKLLNDLEPSNHPFGGTPFQRSDIVRENFRGRKGVESELGNDAHGRSRAADGPEKIWVLRFGAVHNGRVGQNNGGADEPVQRKTLGVRADSVAPVDNVTSDANSTRRLDRAWHQLHSEFWAYPGQVPWLSARFP